ncbi:MAG: endopeptidase La [Metamycoplasmataceae bacterium]
MSNHFFIPVRNEIVFEKGTISIDIGRDISVNTIEVLRFLNIDEVVMIPQKDASKNQIESIEDLRKYGILCKIQQIQEGSNKTFKVSLLGKNKVKINKILLSSEIKELEKLDYDKTEFFYGEFSALKITFGKTDDSLDFLWEEITSILKETPRESKLFGIVKKDQDPSQITSLKVRVELCNFMVNFFDVPFESKYKLFSAKNAKDYFNVFLEILTEYISLIEIDEDIDKDVRKKLDSQQREFLLRERMKVIRNKLGEESDSEDKLEQILNSDELKEMIPEDVKIIIKNEKSKLKHMMSSSPDANITRTYIELLSELPWRKVGKETLDIKKAKGILDEYHYGLKEVKERIIEFIAVLINNENKNKRNEKKDYKILSEQNFELDMNLFNKKNGVNVSSITNPSPIITLLGPPGTGKTSLAKAIAEALDRKFVKISLGGVKDEAEIRGHRRTYIGAMPGKIIRAIKKSGVSNPLILLDEIDKMSSDHKGDPASAMLEVLDPEQNANFQDHYLEVEYDLSKVMFLATANYFENIPTPLLDRVELIELNSYTINEKINIAKKHLIKNVLKQHSLEEKFFQINDEDIEYLIKHYTLEAGVRNLKRVFDKLARKIIVKIIEGKVKDDFVINKKEIEKLLGPIKISDDENDKEPQIGSVNGLAYTAYGGSTLAIEVTSFKGKGELKLTGQLKDVMQESAQIALAYVRSNAQKYDIDFNWDENSIHIHVPEGAVPKDGPSAGVTFTTAIISALSKKPVSHLYGMTGEITLRGKVLAIGGLKEKSLAAYRYGIKTIFIPKGNKRNLVDVPKEVKDSIEFIPVSHYDEIYKYIFSKNKK